MAMIGIIMVFRISDRAMYEEREETKRNENVMRYLRIRELTLVGGKRGPVAGPQEKGRVVWFKGMAVG